IISIQQYYTDEFEKKTTNYCVRFGHSLWSANQLPTQRLITYGAESDCVKVPTILHARSCKTSDSYVESSFFKVHRT
ncbi:unnamed protein product, partial [Heterotrigona itama]